MQLFNAFMDVVHAWVRKGARKLAHLLNVLSGGKLTPTMVTIVGLLMHLPIAWLIASYHFTWAALLLVVFGLFDTLDGELARLQGSSSPAGMFLDSVTDRMKEVILYVGIVYALVVGTPGSWEFLGQLAAVAVAACGGSVLVSYINAWGEVAIAQSSKASQAHKTNKSFRGGLMRFEVRMFMLIVGLLTGQLDLVVVALAILVWVTVFQRLNNVMRRLS